MNKNLLSTLAGGSFLAGVILMLVFTLLRGVIGVQMNLVPESPVVINRETIAFSLGLFISFVILQFKALAKKSTEDIVTLSFYFIFYALGMSWYANDIVAWVQITFWVLCLLGTEYITLTLLRRKSIRP